MSIFDLIFLGVFFTTVFLVVAALAVAVLGRGRVALAILGGLGILLVAYLAVIAAMSLTSPQRVFHPTERRCFDDWCIAVDDVQRTPAGAEVSYAVALRLSSQARGRPQRETGVSLYLLDDQGRRYAPDADPQAQPLDVLLAPGQAAAVTRRFTLPADAGNPGLVVAHGRFPGLFIIGDDQSLLHKPSFFQLQ